jgi:hypothetical protein
MLFIIFGRLRVNLYAKMHSTFYDNSKNDEHLSIYDVLPFLVPGEKFILPSEYNSFHSLLN